jgi:hypothetical protein
MEVFMFSELITRFSRKSPISVMNRALLENIFELIASTRFLKTIAMHSEIASGCFRQLLVLCFWWFVRFVLPFVLPIVVMQARPPLH